MTFQFTVSDVIPASPDDVYEAWLDSDGHSKMTGSPAHASSEVGGNFDAWDGYISGKNLELEPARRIVQLWRGASYKDSDEDSQIEVIFEAVEGGTFRIQLVTQHHDEVACSARCHGWRVRVDRVDRLMCFALRRAGESYRWRISFGFNGNAGGGR